MGVVTEGCPVTFFAVTQLYRSRSFYSKFLWFKLGSMMRAIAKWLVFTRIKAVFWGQLLVKIVKDELTHVQRPWNAISC